MKNSSDTIGNRTHDLPACSAVSQLTVPPRASMARSTNHKASSHVSLSSILLGHALLSVVFKRFSPFFRKCVIPSLTPIQNSPPERFKFKCKHKRDKTEVFS
jgi:hypothetical protein